MSSQTDFRALVLYDGYCVLCNWFVRFVLRVDRKGRIGFAPLDSEAGRRNKALIPPEIDSVVLLRDGRAWVKSEAVFHVFKLVGGVWKGLLVFQFLPRRFRDGVYDWVARRRNKIFGAYDSCPLPEERYRDRFIV